MLYLAIRPFHLFIYCPKRFVVADFYILSTFWELLWELNKMVFSIPGPAQQGLPPSPRHAGNYSGPISRAAPTAYYHRLLQLAPKSVVGHTDIMSPWCATFMCRPKSMRKTNSWLSDSQTSTSHAFSSSSSPDSSAETAPGGWCEDHMTTEIPWIKASIVYFS